MIECELNNFTTQVFGYKCKDKNITIIKNNYAKMTQNSSNVIMCNSSAMASNALCNTTYYESTDWPLERVVSMVVPVFFGIIGLIGLMGNALVIIGECE